VNTRDERSLLDDILDAAGCALLVLAPDGTPVLASAAAERVLGLAGAKLLGSPLHQAVEFVDDAGATLPEDRLPWVRAIAENAAIEERMRLRTSRGTAEIGVSATNVSAFPGVILVLEEEPASLVESLRGELAHSTVLQEVAVVSTSSPDLRVVSTRVLKALARHLGMVAGDIRVASVDGSTLRLVASHGYPEEMIRLIEEVPAAGKTSIAQRSYSTGAILTDAEDRTDPERAAFLETGRHRGVRYISMPVDVRKRRIGVITLAFPGAGPFRKDEIGLFHAIAHTIGQAIEGAHLLEAEKESRRAATAELEISNLLLEAAEQLSRPLELQGVCDTLAESLQRVSGRSRVVVALHQQRQNRMVVTALRNASKTQLGESSGMDGLPVTFLDHLSEGRPIVVRPDSSSLPEGQRERAKKMRALLALAVPMRAHDRLLGFATIDEPGCDRPFTDREIRLVESVASQAAVLIENARAYESEHRIAETLQETLLLMPDRVPGVRFGTLYRSATAAARVGGDFYDLFDTADGRVALVVGDVSGKGLDAASVTALARNAVRIHASEGLSPAEVMRRTNEVLRRSTSAETFVTAFFGELDTRTGALRYVSAGHPEGMIVGKGGYVRTLRGESPLLGALEGVEFVERVTVVAPSDTIFVYTDGVTEARRGRELFGLERLAEFLRGVEDNDPVELPGKVFAAIEAFSEGRLRDDVAILAVRREHGEECE
jgi:serine phosphatase RsbU (regulator of sigma subunit)